MKMNKKIFLTGILLLWSAVCLLAQPVAERCSHEYVSFQGMTREYWMYVPENLPAGAPLMVALHGYGGSALKMKPGLIDLAQEKIKNSENCKERSVNNEVQSCCSGNNFIDFLCLSLCVVFCDKSLYG